MIKHQEAEVKFLEGNKAALKLVDGQMVDWVVEEDVQVGDKLKIIVSSTKNIVNEILKG